MKRYHWLGLVVLVYGICTGCGETFRPIIIPNPPVFPNPKGAHTVLSINDNGTSVAGTAMVIDVSGDTNISVGNVGLAPVHAVQQTATQVLVVNRSVPGPLNTGDSITKLDFQNLVIISPATISLPSNSEPNFIAAAPSSSVAYVTLPNYVPDPTSGTVVPSVGVVSTNANNLQNTAEVGSNPVGLAVTPDNTKLYVANQGSGTITAFDIVSITNLSPRGLNGSLSSPPIWLSPRSDSQAVYVLEASGTLAFITIASTAGPDTLAESAVNVPFATTMTYDSNLNRLYIAGGNPGAPVLAIVDVSQSVPTLLATIPVPPFVVGTSSVSATAVAATALPDGSRAYVASYAKLPSQVSISSVVGDGTTATYAYSLTSGHDLTSGVSVTISGTQQPGFDGTFIVSAVVSGTATCPGTCFQVPNVQTLGSTSVAATAAGSNIFPQVTVVWVSSNTVKTTVGMPGFPDATDQSTPEYYAPVCAGPPAGTPYRATFRFMMASGGDSSRAYMSSCDGGLVDIIDTTNDTYFLNMPAPVGTRAPIPPSPLNPPQNPVFLLAGP